MKKILSIAALTMLVGGISSTAMAGTYYTYANFSSSTSAFLGGYDVDGYGDYLYVNRNGTDIDRYTVTTAPDTATQNVDTTLGNIGPDEVSGTADDNNGPMLTRTLTHDMSYRVPLIGGISVSEIYATSDRLYFLDNVDAVSYYQFSDSSTGTVTASLGAAADVWGEGSLLARSAGGTWYAGGEWNDIFTYDGSNWNKIIDHTVSPNGGHLDGLEIVSLDVTDDGIDNAEEWLFAADMTSNYMQRYSLAGVWQEQYTYNDMLGLAVEGMGFGPNNHFWATGSGRLYEIGGGAFTGAEEENEVPEPGTMLLMGTGLTGLLYARRRKAKKA